MHTSGRRMLGTLLVAATMTVAAGCGSDDTSPTGPSSTGAPSSGAPSATASGSPPAVTTAPAAAALVADAGTAVKAVTSAHFVIAVTGNIPDLQVQGAEGDLTSVGDAQGTATIGQGGQLVEIEFVIVGPDLFVKGATGGFTKIPAALAGQVYDPTAILDPAAGVAAVLASATGLSAVTESDGGYVVSGTVPKAVAASLTPGITADVAGTFTIDASTSLPRSVSFGLTGSDGQPASVLLSLSDYDKDVSITAPAGS